MEKKVKITIKLVAIGECYEMYMDDQYIKLFNHYWEGYQNYLDAEKYFKNYLMQNGYDNIEVKYDDGNYIIEGSIMTEQKEELLKKYESYGFDENQMSQIRWGYDSGLTKEQVSTYADPEINGDQMKEIREEMETELTDEQNMLDL